MCLIEWNDKICKITQHVYTLLISKSLMVFFDFLEYLFGICCNNSLLLALLEHRLHKKVRDDSSAGDLSEENWVP